MYLMNYNFMTDDSVIDPAPARVPVINGVQLSNAIFDHLNILNSGTEEYSTEIPLEWTNDTIINANFNGNINAGNLDYSTEELAGVYIKRRVKGTFAWLTLYDIAMETAEDLSLTRYDLLNQHGVTYEYAFVPYLKDYTECAYIVKEVESSLDGVFVCSPTAIVKFYGGLSYGAASVANRTGVFEPLGTKYPIVVSNANTQYYKGSLQSTALSFTQLMDSTFNRVSNTDYLNALTNFLTDKTTKIIKDWNGNIWLVAVLDDASISYNNNVGMGLGDVGFSFVEIGSAKDQNALQTNGFINIGFTPTNNTFKPENNPRPENDPVVLPGGM
jgi:hypothetical protein